MFTLWTKHHGHEACATCIYVLSSVNNEGGRLMYIFVTVKVIHRIWGWWWCIMMILQARDISYCSDRTTLPQLVTGFTTWTYTYPRVYNHSFCRPGISYWTGQRYHSWWQDGHLNIHISKGLPPFICRPGVSYLTGQRYSSRWQDSPPEYTPESTHIQGSTTLTSDLLVLYV